MMAFSFRPHSFALLYACTQKQLYLTAYPQKPVDNPVHKTGIITWVSC